MITTRKIFRPLIEKRKRHQATIAMPNGLHQQLGQHTRCSSRLHAAAPVCANPGVDTGACLIDAGFSFSPPDGPRSGSLLTTFRMNTCKSVSKQRTLTIFRINTCEKPGGGVVQ